MSEKLPDFFKNPHRLASKTSKSPILVALSGGADSAALLYLLCSLRERESFPLYAAHINHNIRTQNREADRDEQFCRALCERLNVTLFVDNVDVPRLAEENKNSLESQAREARYSFFAKIMKEHRIQILATAHNADDNLETQIFNLCRGCSIDGICGIPEQRGFDALEGGIIVRPILSATKAEILELCREIGIEYVTDSTNFEDDCTRNIIRHRVTPELCNLFNNPQKSSMRLSMSAREDSDFILGEAKNFLAEHRGSIPLSHLNSLHRSVAKRVVLLAYQEYLKDKSSLEAVHIESILSLATGAAHGSAISLPKKIRAKIKDGSLIFEPDCPDKEKICFNQQLNEGKNFISGTPYAVSIEKSLPENTIYNENKNVYRLYTSAYIRNANIVSLSAKSRIEGDKILDGGLHKKIKKLLCDNKIDTEERQSLPIIYQGNEAIYLPFCAVSDNARASKKDFEYIISIYKRI